MAKRLSKEEKTKKRLQRETDRFIASVRAFLIKKNGGQFEEVWEASLLLLASYYNQYITMNEEISNLPSMVIEGRYGPTTSPLLLCRDKASVRLEALMKEMGISFKTSIKLNLTAPKEEESPLELFVKNKVDNE